jgi:heat shock protein HslJ
MTALQELLERAAETETVRFGAADVRRRVQRRSRRRRSAMAAVALVLIAGATVWAVTTRTGDTADRTDVATGPGDSETGDDIEGVWAPIAYSAVVVPPPGVYIELEGDGTLYGNDGCNSFSATWSVDRGHLIVGEIEQTLQACDPEQDTHLIDILRDQPEIAQPATSVDGERATLELHSDRGFVAFEPANEVPPDAPGLDSPCSPIIEAEDPNVNELERAGLADAVPEFLIDRFELGSVICLGGRDAGDEETTVQAVVIELWSDGSLVARWLIPGWPTGGGETWPDYLESLGGGPGVEELDYGFLQVLPSEHEDEIRREIAQLGESDYVSLWSHLGTRGA